MRTPPGPRPSGTTLVELIMTIMIVSVALAGVLTVINLNARTSADPMMEHQAIAIAEAYLEEILTKEFTNPEGGDVGGPETGEGETRATYDDVNDYHGLTDNGARDQNNNAIAGLESYVVSVAVTTSNPLSGISTANQWYVQVTVQPPLGQVFTFSGYRTNY